MDTSAKDESAIYAPPKAAIGGDIRVRPWRSFWIAFVGYFVLLPVLAYLAVLLRLPVKALLPLLLAVWLLPISLVTSSQRRSTGRLGIRRRLLIYAGLTVALAASVIFWFGVASNFLSHPIEVKLPQRR